LLLHQGTLSATSESEHAFREALRIAREQHARSFELRAALSWGEGLARTNRLDEAQRLLRRSYHGRFTEGADTLDHQEARALLQRLS
jgi:adenylate cyclase